MNLLPLVLALPALTAPAAGEGAQYTFARAPVNARGIESLDDLRGRPVLLEFWGTR